MVAALVLEAPLPATVQALEERYFRRYFLPRMRRFGRWAKILNAVLSFVEIPTGVLAMLAVVRLSHLSRISQSHLSAWIPKLGVSLSAWVVASSKHR